MNYYRCPVVIKVDENFDLGYSPDVDCAFVGDMSKDSQDNLYYRIGTNSNLELEAIEPDENMLKWRI